MRIDDGNVNIAALDLFSYGFIYNINPFPAGMSFKILLTAGSLIFLLSLFDPLVMTGFKFHKYTTLIV
jgi:hypothetical protein